MSNQRVNKIVLSCESRDPEQLVKSVNLALTEKVIGALQNKKATIGKSLLEHTGCKSETDNYESYEPKVQEAIDYVVESILESELELENTICIASKQYAVKEESLREYFDSLLESGRTETQVVSTSSDDHDEKGGVRDDEDTNKRVRYESATLTFKDGKTMVIKEGFWENNIDPVMQQLSKENKNSLMALLTSNKAGFMKAVEYCHKVALV
jgi:hypothetical protein